MVGGVALLVDRQRPPIERLGVTVQGLCSQQQAKVIHERRCQVENSGGGRVLRRSLGMWRKRLGLRPRANVVRAGWPSRIDQSQRLDQAACALVAREAAP